MKTKTVMITFIILFLFGCSNDKSTNPSDDGYTNASLNGVWILAIPVAMQEEGAKYIMFNGKGIITEMGAYNMATPAGTYIVHPNGSFSGVVYDKDSTEFSLNGQFNNTTNATVGNDTLSFPMIKVMNLGACQGNWSGSFVQDSIGTTYNVQMVIYESGSIQSCTGFAGPVYGRFFHESNYLVGHFYTGEPHGWNQIGIENGSLTGNIMTGNFGIDYSGWTGGSFTLTR